MGKLKLAPTGILDPCGKYPNPFTKKEWPEYYKGFTDNCTHDPFWFKFPTWEDRREIFRKIHENQIILVTAGTGVGKTFIVPKLFSHYFNYEKGIIMTVPKKTLVEEGANQVSLFLGVPYKKKIWQIENGKGSAVDDPEDIETGYKYVGIKHSGEKRFDKTTKILFSTDGSLAVTVCKTDPLLKEFNGLMIDEAHERNISIDILLSMCAKICRVRPEFKVMIMSATISREMVADYFSRQGLGKRYTLYNTEALQEFDKETIFLNKQDVKIADLTDDMMNKINNLLLNTDGRMDQVFGDDNYAIIDGKKRARYTKYGRDILGFVATTSKINTVIKFLEEQRDKGLYKYRPAFLRLTANSNQETKDMAYDSDGLEKYNKKYGENCQLKVMISTNVAESSVTFKEALGFVFDTGTIFQVGYDPERYGEYQREAFTAKANIAQRKGRTGRNCFGRYYPSYSENQWDNEIVDYEPAPITKTDLTDTCLNVCLMPDVKNMLGCVDFFNNMLEPINRIQPNLKVAFNNLHDYDMMYKGELTPLGRICSKFGEYNYQIVRMIVCAFHLDGILVPILKLACLLTQCRSFDDLFDLPVGKSLQEMPKAVQENIMAIKKEYAYPAGEHLSMLFLYDAWLSLPEYQRPYLEKYYKLRVSKFKDIEASYKILAETVYNNLQEIRDLKLFKKYPRTETKKSQSGGSLSSAGYDIKPESSPEQITREYLLDTTNNNYGFTGSMFNEPTKVNFENHGFKLGCASSHSNRISMLDKIHKCRGGNGSFPLMKGLIGGGENNDNYDIYQMFININQYMNHNSNNATQYYTLWKEYNDIKAMDTTDTKKKQKKKIFLSILEQKVKELYEKVVIHNKPDIIPNNNTLQNSKIKGGNRGQGRGRGQGLGKGQGRGKGRGKKLSQKEIEERKRIKEKIEKRKIMIEKMKDFLKSKEFSMRGMFARCPEYVVDIGNTNELSVDEKVQLALYFGFCNQVAMKIDTPESKKYVVKYSDTEASIKKSMLVLMLNKAPQFVLYHSFMLSDEFDSSLSIVSHLTFPIIERFMNAKTKLITKGLL